MRVTVTGATGLIGTKLVKELMGRGDDVTVLSRSPGGVGEKLGDRVDAIGWDPNVEAAPVSAFEGRDAVIHLAGEPVAQRWSDAVKRRIHDSRETGTRNLVSGLRAMSGPKPEVLVSSSAVGIYGPHGDETLPEATPAGTDFLAQVCVAWEREAHTARELGLRVVCVRTGVVLDQAGGALKTMLPPFKLGVGGPVAGGKQYMPWVHADDVVGILIAGMDGAGWDEPVNATAPTPVTNKTFSKALGKALHRPAFSPVPGAAIRLLYGDMAEIVTKGQRAIPERTQALGYTFKHPDLDEALRSALGK